MWKKKNVYFCNKHIRILSTYKATTPVPKHKTLSYFPGTLECVRELVFLAIFALAAVLLAVATYSLRAGVKHDRSMLTLRV